MRKSPGEEPGADYSDAFRRILARLELEQERAREERDGAAARYDELMTIAPPAREAAIRNDERYASFALATRLLDASLEVRLADPQAGLELSRLALIVTERLDPGRYGAGLMADLKARCWAYLGDASGGSDPPGALQAFDRARQHLVGGSGDPLAEAEVFCLEARLLEPSGGSEPVLGGPARVH